jgi:DNA polymerase-3 subunit beta
MTSPLDATAPVRPLADAAALAVRLLTARSPQPVHAAVLLRAADAGLTLTATDGALTVRLEVPATVHAPGETLISRRGLADTLSGLPSPQARLSAEGARLAVKVPGARFALPVLADAWPPVAPVPPETTRVDGAALRAAAAAVAGAASREHALPIFTGVRLRAAGPALSLLATDRYRLAAATVPALPGPQPPPRFEALIPAALLTRIAPVLGRAEAVGLHATGDLFALSWPGGSVVTPTLGDSYPDAQFDRLLDVDPECVVELDADALAAAVERAASYAGEHGRLTLQTIEGAVLVRAADPLRGESEESVKAALRSGQATRAYQSRLLADALHAFAGQTVSLRMQAGLRATEVTTATSDLRYLIVPMRPTDQP